MTITIRRASPKDAAAYARFMNDPAVFAGLMQMPHTDEEIWRIRLTEACDPAKTDLPLVAVPPVDAATGHTIGASVGVAIHPEHGSTAAELLAAADHAMYEAKQAGKRRVRVATAG